MRDGDDERQAPFNQELVGLLQHGLRAKARVLLFFLGLAVVTFVWAARDAGAPLWLVTLVGVFGAVLIGLAIVLVWFWLRFLDHFRRVGQNEQLRQKPSPPSDRS